MKYKHLVFVLSATLALAACKSSEEKAAEESAKQMEEASKKMQEAAKSGQVNIGDAMNAMTAAMNAANAGKKVETVDFRELKELLPESLPGMKRTNATGEKTAAMGMQVSTAKGDYSGDAGRSVTLNITDIGSMTGLAGMAAYAWAATDFDRETETGYEKTTKHKGYKAHEKFDRSSKSGEISVLVGDRFIVAAQGNGIEIEALKSTIDQVDLGKLDGMKGKGVQ